MNFKPKEFFIGLVEFITILLPGIVLALIILLVESKHPVQLDRFLYQYVFSEDTKAISWVAIIFSSFGLGYFLSSFASGLDPLYDKIRKQIYPYEEDLRARFARLDQDAKNLYRQFYEEHVKAANVQEKGKATEDEKSFEGFRIKYRNNVFRKALHFIFELELTIKIDSSFGEALKILLSQPEGVNRALNVYKWAGTILEAQYPNISEQATRVMSASKFFRSMVVVSLIFLALQIFRQLPFDLWEINLLILLLSFREYIVQRQKSVQKTYQSIVALAHFKDPAGLNI